MFAILRFFSSEFKNEVKCFSVNIQYSTEMKDKVQTKEESKIKILKLFKSAFFCVNYLQCALRMDLKQQTRHKSNLAAESMKKCECSCSDITNTAMAHQDDSSLA